jgi:hypothetical protein
MPRSVTGVGTKPLTYGILDVRLDPHPSREGRCSLTGLKIGRAAFFMAIESWANAPKKVEWVHRIGGIPTPDERIAYRSVGRRRCLLVKLLWARL